MSFWTTDAEPLRQHRWFATITPAGISATTFALKKVDKPKAKIGEVTHKYLNHFFYYPGRLEWEPINMTFAAARNPSVDDALWGVLINAGYGRPTAGPQVGNQVSTIGKVKFKSALGATIDIKQVDPNGSVIETWQIVNPFFTSVQFGALDYANEDIVEITTTIRYDYAKLITVDAGVDPSMRTAGPNVELTG